MSPKSCKDFAAKSATDFGPISFKEIGGAG